MRSRPRSPRRKANEERYSLADMGRLHRPAIAGALGNQTEERMMGLVILKLMALIAGVAVIGIFYCWLEEEHLGRVNEGWKRRNRRER